MFKSPLFHLWRHSFSTPTYKHTSYNSSMHSDKGFAPETSASLSTHGESLNRTPVAQLVEHRAIMREIAGEFDSGRTISQGLKITEEKVLPLQLLPHMARLSSILG